MEYSFKKLKISDSDRFWLSEILKYNYAYVDVKYLKVMLRNQLPKGFDPQKIDRRLIHSNLITLLGLWYVDPQHSLFSDITKTILATKDIICKNPGIIKINADKIASISGISNENTVKSLKILYNSSGFFTRASGQDYGFAYQEYGFSDNDDNAYDKFLNFENIEKTLEEYFIADKPNNYEILNSKYSDNQIQNDLSQNQITSKQIWDNIFTDYSVRKQTFGKKINFIEDKFKRDIIYRDVEHAYYLEKIGLSKPSVILSGSVIEELLRLYLKSKKIRPNKESYEMYVKACKDNGLLKSSIHKLTDSVRDFRNLVHLSREKNQGFTISKANAKGAVSIIFSMITDF